MEHQLSFLSTRVSSKKKSMWKLYVDGASRGNPGFAGAGVYITHNDQEITSHYFFLGKKTNNQAEYFALILGLFYLENIIDQPARCTILSDSELLIRQMNGIYKVKDAELKKLFNIVQQQLQFFSSSSIIFKHIVREHNTHADALANKGIDTKKHLPQKFLKFLETLKKCN